MLTKKQKRIAGFFSIIFVVILLCWFALPKLIVVTLPFIIAYVISRLIEPIVKFLNKKLKIPRKIGSAIVVILTVALLSWLISSIISRIVIEINNLISQKDVIALKILSTFYSWQDFFSRYVGSEFGAYILNSLDLSQITSNLSSFLVGYIKPTIENALDIAKSFPTIIIFTVVLIIGTYFMSVYKERISKSLHALVPRKIRRYFDAFTKDMSFALLGYIKAQLTLMSVTFLELTIGFTFLGGDIANYALLLGLVISVIDAFPILGTGTVLIPWGLYSLITGDIRLGVSLLILYGICLMVRQILEPRVLGKQIGLHPLITLMTMYIGLKLFGILGMIIGPVSALIIKNFYESGMFERLWYFIIYGGDEIE